MPNIINTDGIQVKTATELITEISTDLRTVYGNEINIDQNTPDGQNINIFSQACVDTLDLIAQVHASFDPDQAIGKNLDARVQLNGIQRLGGGGWGNFVLLNLEPLDMLQMRLPIYLQIHLQIFLHIYI